MKHRNAFYPTAMVLFMALLHISCDKKKESNSRQLILDTHFQAEFPESEYPLDSELPIGIYITDNKSSVTLSNLQYEKGEEGYTLTDSRKIDKSDFKGKEVNIYAYFPYQNIKNPSLEQHPVRVETDQQNPLKYQASDFIYATTENKALNTNIALKLKPKFAKITINIKKTGAKETDSIIDGKVMKVATSANINLKTGDLSGLEDTGTITLMKQSISHPDFICTLEGIIIPQEIPAHQPFLSIEINGKPYFYKTDQSIEIEPETEYIYNVTIDNHGISVESETKPRIKDSDSGALSITTHSYKIGDYYPMANDKLSAIGIVFTISGNGAHGKIISLDEALDMSWGPSVNTGANSKTSGAINMAILKQDCTNRSYEGFSWCQKKGKDWYLPAINELGIIYKQKDILNRSLSPLLRANNLGDGVYLSSTEHDTSNALVLYFGDGRSFQQNKALESHVRAICEF